MAAPAPVAKQCPVESCDEQHDISEHMCVCGMFGHNPEHHNDPAAISVIFSGTTVAAQCNYISLMQSMPDLFGSMTCRVAWCTMPTEHITAGHYCIVCNSYGHGSRSHSAVSDGFPEIKPSDSIVAIRESSRGDFMPGESCTYPGCKYLHTHKSSYHLCSVCDTYGGNKDCNNCRVIAPCEYCATAANAGHTPSCHSWFIQPAEEQEREIVNPAEEGVMQANDEYKQEAPAFNMQGLGHVLYELEDDFVDFDEAYIRSLNVNPQQIIEANARAPNTYCIKCPECRVVNTVDITKDYIAGLSGRVPENHVADGENNKHTCFCAERWADVVMPTCRHLGCCKECIPRMDQVPEEDNYEEELD